MPHLPLLVPYRPSRVLSLLTSYKFLALILLSVVALSVSLPQLSATLFRNQSVRLIKFNSFLRHLKTHFSKQPSTAPWRQTPAPPIQLIHVTNGAL